MDKASKTSDFHLVLGILEHYLSLYSILFNEMISLSYRTGAQGVERGRNFAPGLCITPEQAEVLLNPDVEIATLRHELLKSESGILWEQKLEQYRRELRESLSLEEKSHLMLLLRRFSFSWFETLVLIACLAPEIQGRYQKIYAYLQDDITAKLPAVDWVMALFFPADMDEAHRSLSFQGTLLRMEIVTRVSSQNHIGSCDFLKLDPRILQFLFCVTSCDEVLSFCCEWNSPGQNPKPCLMPQAISTEMESISTRLKAQTRPPLWLAMSGSCDATRSLAFYLLCRQMNLGMLSISLPDLMTHPERKRLLLRVLREARLSDLGIFLSGMEALTEKEALIFAQELETFPHPACFSIEKPDTKFFWLCRHPCITWNIADLSYDMKIALWQQYLPGAPFSELAARYGFTPVQIHRAVVVAGNLSKNPENPGMENIYQACRMQFSQVVDQLAIPITCQWQWDDIILKPEVKSHLQELCARFQYQHQVYQTWGFDQKISMPHGISALFTGPPGTGKTMAASIIARQLWLDIYKIDLAQVVSKYIGETEKNLERIFTHAEKGNLLLFFDEADALFGKRTEVKDAHDRYANMEVSYLLQRIERYPGMVIMASNFPENIDEAFLRRLHEKIEFPFPDEATRKILWQKAFGDNTPRNADIDFHHLALRFPLSGGYIQNIVLSAAFLAASQKKPVSILHLLYATRREYEKIGKDFPDS